MPTDPSIILGIKSVEMPNPLESATKALTVRSLMQQGESNQLKLNQERIAAQDAQSMRDAYKHNTTIGPDGQPSLDTNGMYAELAKTNPAQAIKFSLDQRQLKIEQLQQKQQLTQRIAFGIHDQASLDEAIRQTRELNLPPLDNAFPGGTFDPKRAAVLQNSTLEARDQLSEHHKTIQEQRQQQEANTKEFEAEIKAHAEGIPVRIGKAGAPAAAGAGGATPSDSAPGGLSEADPAEMLGKVPAKDRDKVAAQIDAAKNATRNGPKIMDAFDNAYDQHVVDYVPGMLNAHQKAYHALMGPTFKDVEGTVRQAAMDNMFENTTPQFGDRGETPGVKRNAVKDYLLDKQNAALAKYYGIDLSKFKSTNAKAALEATGKGPKDSKSDDYAIGTTAKTKSGVPVVYRGKGVWEKQ